MLRQWSLNLILLLLIITLVGIALFQPGIEETKSHLPLTDLKADRINTITVSRPSHEPVTLKRTQGKWYLTKPIESRASEFVVNSILATLHTPSLNQLAYSEKNDSRKYGFDAPRAIITLNETTVTFGDTNPLSQQQYVLYNGQVHMINGNLLWSLRRGYNEYIDRRLLASTDSPVAIVFPDGKTLALKNGSWTIKGTNKSLSSDSLTRLVNEWRYANALRVAPYEQGHAQRTVQIFYKAENQKKAKVIKLDILSKKPELVLVRKDEGLQYHFPADTGNRLFLPK